MNIVWRIRPEAKSKPSHPRKNWPRLRVINNTFVAYAEADVSDGEVSEEPKIRRLQFQRN